MILAAAAAAGAQRLLSFCASGAAVRGTARAIGVAVAPAVVKAPALILEWVTPHGTQRSVQVVLSGGPPWLGAMMSAVGKLILRVTGVAS